MERSTPVEPMLGCYQRFILLWYGIGEPLRRGMIHARRTGTDERRIFHGSAGPFPGGRPAVEELRLDLRAVLQRCRPDWDISSAEQRTAWGKGEKARFHPYGKTQPQVLAEQD